MDQQRTFGSWLRSKRKALDLTQAGLAGEVGCSAAAVRKIEAEERRPSAQIVERLVEIFHIPAHERIPFLRFARGDWQYAPHPPQENEPWRVSDGPVRSNLAAPLTSLIGREQAVAEVRGYITDTAIRLVTLMGPPGIGKTRLSLEAARKAIPDFLDGVFFVSLVTLDDPDLLAQRIVQTLGFVETKDRSALEILKDGIGDKQMLLVLDNLEHLIESAAALIPEILSVCQRLKILVTSRESLRVLGEWLYQVPALSTPFPPELQAMNLDMAASYSALKLFFERARAVRPDFLPGPDDFQAVAAICIQLDGLPLAIELFAAQMRLLTPQALLSQLRKKNGLHSESMRALPARQKTLHNAIRWSYDLLSEEEKHLFAGLAVFSGGFTLAAAEAIFSPTSTAKSVTDLVGQLLDKSLLQRTTDTESKPRVRMLVTIQQFAAERLREGGVESAVREQHLAYFLDLAEQGDKNIHGRDQVEWIDRLEVERDNFRTGLDWCLSRQNIQAGLRMLTALQWSWWLRGHGNEVSNWWKKISVLPELTKYPALHAKMLNRLGRQSWFFGDFSCARALLEESRAICLAMGADGEQSLAESCIYLGMVAHTSNGDVSKAQYFFEQSLELDQKWGDSWGKALVWMNMGWIALGNHQLDPAVSWLEQSLDMFQKLEDIWGMGRCSQFLGDVYLRRGNNDSARHLYEQHLLMDERLHYWEGTAVALGNLGNYCRHLGDYDQAEQFYQKSLVLSRTYGLKWVLCNIFNYLGLLALRRNDYLFARQCFIDCFQLARTIYEGAAISIADILNSLAAVAGGMHRPERAAKLSGACRPYMKMLASQDSPLDLAEFNRHIRNAQEEISEAAFEAFANEGGAMSPEQAVAYALEDINAQTLT